ELWKGGPNIPTNGVTLCRGCHKLKTSPGDDASWHSFAKRYAAVVERLGFTTTYGLCPDHRHHYLIVRSGKADASDKSTAPIYSSLWVPQRRRCGPSLRPDRGLRAARNADRGAPRGRNRRHNAQGHGRICVRQGVAHPDAARLQQPEPGRDRVSRRTRFVG